MSELVYFLIGLLVGYYLWKRKPSEHLGSRKRLAILVEYLLRHLADRNYPRNSTMIEMTREAVSLGCDLDKLLEHYNSIDPELQSGCPRQNIVFGDICFRYLHDYVPQRLQYLDCERKVANRLYSFKAGDYTHDMLYEFVDLLKEQELDKFRFLLICMPASTQYKTVKRYENFSDHLCRVMGWEDGFGIIRPIDHASQHESGRRVILDERHYFIDYNRLKGKRVMLLDDVFTTGKTLLSLAGIIRRAGGYPTDAIFYCKTLMTKRATPPVNPNPLRVIEMDIDILRILRRR